MNIFRRKNLFMAGALSLAFGLNAQNPKPEPSVPAPAWPRPDPAAVARWQALRFGMFIHWGPVSLTGREISWSRGAPTPIEVYDNLYKEFNPANFNAGEWVGLAKAAGMKYIVLTTKHHDGFCLWDTKQTDYNIMQTPFHRDVVKELAAACRKEGLAFGAYYSVCDWHHPDFPLTSPGGTIRREKSDLDSYNRYLLAQISELITNYGPLLTIWNDVPQEFQGRGANTIKLARSLQPDILLNNRTGDGGDYDTPEQRIGQFQIERPWESCMTISAHNVWAWGGAKDGVKSLAACLGMVIRGAGGDGNVLLNVGPRPDGVIDPEQAGRLKEIGAWLAKNGESIYGTRGGPWKPTASFASTRKGDSVFLHILRSDDGVIELPALPGRIKSASLLGGGLVESSQKNGKLLVTVPKASLDAMDTIVRLELDGPALDVPVLSFATAIKAAASNTYQNDDQFGPQQAFDNDPDTRWATDFGTKQAWISADLGQSKAIFGLRIQEAAPYAGRIQKFEFQYRDGGEWKTIFTGERIGAHFEKKFDAVSAPEFRLYILDATEGPTISEIELVEK
ncbi:MAG: alpha-L-fucosidase [Verrucomicrobiota bacterium]